MAPYKWRSEMQSPGWTSTNALDTFPMKYIGTAVLFLFLSSGAAWGQAQIVAQIVDGDVWQTTIVLTNSTAAPANASLSFFKETGSDNATQAWNLTFAEVASTAAIPIPAGATRFLHTPGAGGPLSVGWGTMTADAGVVAYAIFTKRPPGQPAQVGTSPAIPSSSRILVPFDNTGDSVAAMAVVNASGAPETISVNFRTTAGTVSQAILPTIPGPGTCRVYIPRTVSYDGKSKRAGGVLCRIRDLFDPQPEL